MNGVFTLDYYTNLQYLAEIKANLSYFNTILSII